MALHDKGLKAALSWANENGGVVNCPRCYVETKSVTRWDTKCDVCGGRGWTSVKDAVLWILQNQ